MWKQSKRNAWIKARVVTFNFFFFFNLLSICNTRSTLDPSVTFSLCPCFYLSFFKSNDPPCWLLISGEVESEGGIRANMHASRPAGHARLRTVRPGNTVRWVERATNPFSPLLFYLLFIFWRSRFRCFRRLTDKMRSDGPGEHREWLAG